MQGWQRCCKLACIKAQLEKLPRVLPRKLLRSCKAHIPTKLCPHTWHIYSLQTCDAVKHCKPTFSYSTLTIISGTCPFQSDPLQTRLIFDRGIIGSLPQPSAVASRKGWIINSISLMKIDYNLYNITIEWSWWTHLSGWVQSAKLQFKIYCIEHKSAHIMRTQTKNWTNAKSACMFRFSMWKWYCYSILGWLGSWQPMRKIVGWYRVSVSKSQQLTWKEEYMYVWSSNRFKHLYPITSKGKGMGKGWTMEV